MIRFWIGQKLRFLSHVCYFLCGLLSLLVPWFVFLLMVVVCLGLDYSAFRFEYSDEKTAAE